MTFRPVRGPGEGEYPLITAGNATLSVLAEDCPKVGRARRNMIVQQGWPTARGEAQWQQLSPWVYQPLFGRSRACTCPARSAAPPSPRYGPARGG
jgi:hypothetical protein